MNKIFFRELSERCNYMSPQTAEMFYNGFRQYIISSLHKDGEVKLPRFGTFKVVHRKERACRDVSTGQVKMFPDVLMVKFKGSARFKAHFNSKLKRFF